MTDTLDGGSDKFRVVDLFAGCGGLTSGFHSTGRYRSVGAVEYDLAAAATYAANFGEESVYWGDIAEWVKGDLPSADVIIGGPPCQGFSNLGKRDIGDPRNSMWRQYVQALVKIKPAAFLLENVPQFQRSGQFHSLEEETMPGGLLSNYSLRYKTVIAANFGAAQLRRRFIVIGTRKDYQRIEVPDGDLPREEWRTVRDTIWELRNSVVPENTELPEDTDRFFGQQVPGAFKASALDFARRYTEISVERMRSIPPEGDRRSLPAHLLAPCWVGRTDGMDVFARLRWDRPSVTIRTEFFKPEKGRYLHPEEHRALSHHEAALLQGFKDDFKWCGTKIQIARQIGNAVPVELAAGLAKHIAATLDRH
ncbi:DNA (cytosine-5-)-methyltransferase [Micromonospora saelicesensis]|uniref:Cytosine-specific methyltransferase n=1 Tax=Micromonospora saelicesensis TaxID=285676 RepID=A0ABX9CJQ1_9ACTN|nr:DNA cytosine methyltransferase [Micromonospora saelicesensis]RAN99780.1 DNA (cytosine-5-)-methyltransferase [Micromonospora saelicesensis]